MSPDQTGLGKLWLGALRDFNASLRSEGRVAEQFSFTCFDMNHWPDTFWISLAELAEKAHAAEGEENRLKKTAEMLGDHDSEDADYERLVRELQGGTAAGDRFGLDEEHAKILREITEVELASISIRRVWSHEAREKIIYGNVKSQILGLGPGGIAGNCGMCS